MSKEDIYGNVIDCNIQQISTSNDQSSSNARETTIVENVPVNHVQQEALHSTSSKCGKVSDVFKLPMEKNVVFCIDTAGTMYDVLDSVKKHLIKLLNDKANCSEDFRFNLIEFSTKITQWSDRMVKCTPQTVAIAEQWLRELDAKSGTNTLDALLSAFSDPCCDAVYLITDGQSDQNTTDILDSVCYAAQNRAVHCYYIQTASDVNSATYTFLRDISLETYGSFYTVAVTEEGNLSEAIHRYSATGSGETIVRTAHGTYFPDTKKYCSLTTSVDSPPTGINVVVHSPDPYLHLIPNSYSQYYYHRLYPHFGWSRYRSARVWSRFIKDLSVYANAGPIPGAGATLIGTRVLARRNEDGHFYIGHVKSQIMNDKFLIEFGPTKHGRFRDTSYQETFVFDIISYTDALRHAILPNDRVLAPFEAEGSRFAPGVVLQGQEKRNAEGGVSDENLIVSFFNGKSATVPFNTAVWLAPSLHDRITFELQLPSNVRQELSQVDTYPHDYDPGYPTSGPVADPEVFEAFHPAHVQQFGPFVYGDDYGDFAYTLPYMVPVQYKYIPSCSVVRGDEVNAMVPGTHMTKHELSDKVTKQLMEYEQLGIRPAMKEKLLEKRLPERDNTIPKSVSFDNKRKADTGELSDIEAEYYSGDLELYDSGDEATTERKSLTICEDALKSSKDASVGTTDRLFRRIRYRSQEKPRWSYWSTNPAPSLMDPMHFGQHRVGPYDQMTAAAPMELRDARISKYGLEWANAMAAYADSSALHKINGSAEGCMSYYMPRPPAKYVQKQGPGKDMCDVIGEKQMHEDKFRQARQEFRRNAADNRNKEVMRDRDEKFLQERIMRDLHKQKIYAQIDKDRQRQIDHVDKIKDHLEAKKLINDEFRQKFSSTQEHEISREAHKFAALQRSRVQRETTMMKQRAELKDTLLQRQEAKEHKAQERCAAVQERLTAEQLMNVQRDAQARQAKINRIEHFRQKEERNQKVIALQAHVKNNSNSVFSSQIFI